MGEEEKRKRKEKDKRNEERGEGRHERRTIEEDKAPQIGIRNAVFPKHFTKRLLGVSCANCCNIKDYLQK